jgi:hypothetical protein
MKPTKLNVSLMVLMALAMFLSMAGCHDWDHHDDHRYEHHELDHPDLGR